MQKYVGANWLSLENCLSVSNGSENCCEKRYLHQQKVNIKILYSLEVGMKEILK